MNAYSIISTLTITRATDNKLETAIRVLNCLEEMKEEKHMPIFKLNKAIRLQKKLINKLDN